ncbi:MAG: FAD-binding oxidoreductase [Rhodobacteraceae bacterium]|nr:FAD-binding oxidoreductase [Paracoccaceae bacterium]
MPGPTPTPVASDSDLPSKVDIVVIGGGIIGCCAALELAERGQSVLLCEKGQIGGEQSSRNWGWVRVSLRDPKEIPLMLEATRIWDGLAERCQKDLGFARSGILFAARSEKQMADYEAWARHLDNRGFPVRMLGHAAVRDLLPGGAEPLMGGLWTPQDARAEPQWAAPAIAEAARAHGAKVMTGCAVRSVDLSAGRISGVVTEKGRVACDHVVLAGGAWSRLFAGNAGFDLPQLKVRNTVLRTKPHTSGPETTVWSADYAIRRRADGGFTIACGTENTVDLVPDSLRLARRFWPAFLAERSSLRFRLSRRALEEARERRRWTPDQATPFEATRILDPEPLPRIVQSSLKGAQAAFPALAGAQVAQTWAGMIDVTPDALPVISGVDDVPGLTIGTGFSGHGFGIGPGAGRLLADLVTGTTPMVDPTPFRFSRFSDGSKLRPDSGF